MVRRYFAALAVCLLATAPLASAQSLTIAELMALREIGGYRSGITVSPDGLSVAFFERESDLAQNDYRYRLMVARVDGGPVRMLAETTGAIIASPNGRPSGAPIDRVPQWSPDGTRLGYVACVEGRVELWIVNVAGGAPRRSTELAGDVERFAWIDSEHLAVETATPRALLAATALHRRTYGFHPDDSYEPYHSLVPYPAIALERAQSVIDIRDGAERVATEADASALTPMRDAPQGAVTYRTDLRQRVWIAPRTAGDRASSPRLGLYVDDGGGARRCEQSQCDGRMIGAWPIGRDVLFVRYNGPSGADTSLLAWDPTSDTVRTLRSGDEALLGCEAAGPNLVCLYETPTQPRRLVAIRPADGALRTLYEPNPNWRSHQLTRIERIYAPDAYGNEGYAHLVYPADWRAGRRYPMVVVQYRSRGFLRGGTGGEYPVHALAARGYFVLSVDRVEWGERSTQLTAAELQTQTELDGSELNMKLSQLQALIAILNERNLIDMDRIGITGMSDGAETAYWALVNTDLFAAAIVSTPPTDRLAWTLGSHSFRQRLTSVSGATGPETEGPWQAWWESNEIARYADKLHAPLLMQFSDGEAILGYPLIVRLRELGRDTDVYIYPDSHHVKWRPQHILSAQERSLAWLDFWLRGIEVPAAGEPSRLERWRALREN